MTTLSGSEMKLTVQLLVGQKLRRVMDTGKALEIVHGMATQLLKRHGEIDPAKNPSEVREALDTVEDFIVNNFEEADKEVTLNDMTIPVTKTRPPKYGGANGSAIRFMLDPESGFVYDADAQEWLTTAENVFDSLSPLPPNVEYQARCKASPECSCSTGGDV